MKPASVAHYRCPADRTALRIADGVSEGGAQVGDKRENVSAGRLVSAAGRSFDPLGETIMMVLTGLASGVAGNLLTDLIKMTVLKAREKKATEEPPSRRLTAVLVQPVGDGLLVVSVEETYEI